MANPEWQDQYVVYANPNSDMQAIYKNGKLVYSEKHGFSASEFLRALGEFVVVRDLDSLGDLLPSQIT